MSDASEIIELGEKLGLAGKDLQDFLRDERASRREARREAEEAEERREAAEAQKRKELAEAEERRETAEAQKRKEIAEAEAQKRKHEEDMARLEHQLEVSRITAEADAKKEEIQKMQIQLEMQKEQNRMREIEENAEARKTELANSMELKRLELDARIRRNQQRGEDEDEEDGNNGNNGNGRGGYKVRPKLPPFDDSKEQVDAYLARFERYAVVQNWHRDTWASSLSALLKGEALNVYYRLPDEDMSDYNALKTALLKRYQLTEDGFRAKFRSARPEKGESFS